MSEDLIKSLGKFRESILDMKPSSMQKSNGYLMNWLIHTNYNLEKAIGLYKKHIEWRQTHNIDQILKEDFSSLLKAFPYEFLGFDNENRPILLCKYGVWNSRKLAEEGRSDEGYRYTIQMFEKLFNQLDNRLNEFGLMENVVKPIQFIILIDMKDYSFSQLASIKNVKLLTELTKTMENYYPNTTFKAIFVNANKLLQMLIKLLTPFMNSYTIDKFWICNDETMEKVQNYIPKENLPKEYHCQASRNRK